MAVRAHRPEAGLGGVRSLLNRTVVIAALGYFVDIYDLILFSVVRRPSLLGLGVAEEAVLDTGVLLLNWQMGGMLLGGILWGVLGDRRGRVTVLFGSILLYSLANLANAFVAPIASMTGASVVTTYAALRFVAGIGLAGELGAAITLVSEVMTKETRGYAAGLVAGFGILGGLVAVAVSRGLDWQAAYIVGGLLGLLLLLARIRMLDSGLFERLRNASGRRGDFLSLFTSRDRFGRYAWSLLVGLPIWFVVGILVTLSPELGAAVGVTGPVDAGIAVLWCYLGLTVGDIASGFLSGWLQSRRWVFIGALASTSALIFAYTMLPGLTPTLFYGLIFLLGLAIGYWAVFNVNAAEQFGTDLRATVATTAPNFVRGALVPVALAFQWLAGQVGLVLSALLVGQATVLIALLAVRNLRETYGRDLDFVESPHPARAANTTGGRGAPVAPVPPLAAATPKAPRGRKV